MTIKNPAAKGKCYTTAWLVFVQHPLNRTPNVLLCHGIAIQTKPPHARMGHAWVEECVNGRWYFRDGLYPNTLFDRDKVYAAGQIDAEKVRRYKWKDAKELARIHDHIGPWDAEIVTAEHSLHGDSLPKGVRTWKPEKAGTYEITVQDNPDQIQPQHLWWKRPFYIHRNIGVNIEERKTGENVQVVCPQTINKPCPICEQAREMEIESAANAPDILEQLGRHDMHKGQSP